MTQTNPTHVAEFERQQLVKECHCLIAAIASRPGSTKLLRGVVPMLQVFASYKQNRARSPSQRKPRRANFDKAELENNS